MLKIQKAKHLYLELEKKKPNCIDKPYMVFEKHDGWFGYLDFPSCVIHSRNYREIPSMVDLSNAIRAKGLRHRGRLIFEIMIEGMEYGQFHKLNGILNRKDECPADVYLQVHDYIPEFKQDWGSAHHRYQFAKEIVNRLNMPQVRLSPVLACTPDQSEWRKHVEAIWAKGGEGIILKEEDATYKAGSRVASLMKIKEELTLDLRVTGVVGGQGKYANTLGALKVVDCHGITHTVSGMSDEERNLWWGDPSSIVGKIVEIKAMKRLSDGSLREPRFKAIRWDKDDTDD